MPPTPATDRRRFLKQIAGLAAALVAPGTTRGGGATDDGLPIIDTHQHLWDLSKFRLNWLAPDSKLNRSFRPDDYRKATEGLNVVKAVYMEVDVVPAQQAEEARTLIDLCRSKTTPTVAAVISGRPASDGFKAYLDRFKDAPEIKGVRQVLHSSETPPGYCLDPKFIAGIRMLGAAGLSFDLCMRAAELPDAARLVDACPETRFILDHCGNPDVLARDQSTWKADLAALAKRDRVVCKVSGILASTKGQPWTPDDLAPIINHVLDSFGPVRVMFGGDWPVCTLGGTFREWLVALRTIVRDRPEADRRKLFSGNAERVYRLTHV
jgi:L-fuconolactonase